MICEKVRDRRSSLIRDKLCSEKNKNFRYSTDDSDIGSLSMAKGLISVFPSFMETGSVPFVLPKPYQVLAKPCR
jgi:hypothetical protein